MDGDTRARASAVLAALADLSPTSEQRATGLAISTEWFRWLPLSALDQFGSLMPPSRLLLDRKFGERLAAVDQVRTDQHALRLGWLFLAGRVGDEAGKARRVFHPLLSLPVKVQRAFAVGEPELVAVGDVELSPRIADDPTRRRLEAEMETGRGAFAGVCESAMDPRLLRQLHHLRNYAVGCAGAAGLPTSRVVPADRGPDELVRDGELKVVAGVAVFAVQEAAESSRASSLRAWAEASPRTWTAFHSVYFGPERAESAAGDGPDSAFAAPTTPAGDRDDEVDSPFLLTPVQGRAVLTSRSADVTLISGAPGTGKSHTIAAIACDALARGENVLVAAKSDATVDALLDLLERSPGPEPVVFGSTDRRRALADQLAAGQLEAVPNHRLERLEAEWRQADEHRTQIHLDIAARLWSAASAAGDHSFAAAARRQTPGLFDADIDLDAFVRRCVAASAPATGWWSRWRRRRAAEKLRRLAGAPPGTPIGIVAEAVDSARVLHAAARLSPGADLDLGPRWAQLAESVESARQARGRWLEADSRSERRLTWTSRSALSVLAKALRSGRSARRDQLAKLKGDHLTEALPLWVGTLADIDDLLPPDAALFDLVVLDEASSIDQPLAATALLRGARAVVAGDPRQLRQVSFVSDAQHAAAVAAHALDTDPALAGRLDVRRNSAFDLAAGAAPVLILDEHFRSDPHLVDFVAQRIYGGKVHVATRSPRTHSVDCIEVVRLDGLRDKAGVVHAELEAAVARARALLPSTGVLGDPAIARRTLPSVGIVTPFRAQADALEEAVLAAFTADELEALDLRIGTAHAFQGNERDLVIVSLGVGPGEGAASWRFVEDPHLFAVLMTRARRRLVVLASADPPAGGLLADYLTQADVRRARRDRSEHLRDGRRRSPRTSWPVASPRSARTPRVATWSTWWRATPRELWGSIARCTRMGPRPTSTATCHCAATAGSCTTPSSRSGAIVEASWSSIWWAVSRSRRMRAEERGAFDAPGP